MLEKLLKRKKKGFRKTVVLLLCMTLFCSLFASSGTLVTGAETTVSSQSGQGTDSENLVEFIPSVTGNENTDDSSSGTANTGNDSSDNGFSGDSSSGGTNTDPSTGGTNSTENNAFSDGTSGEPNETTYEKTASANGYEITIRYTDAAGIPDDAELYAADLTGDDYDSCKNRLETSITTDNTDCLHFFDLYIKSGDTEIQPQTGAFIQISIKFTDETALENLQSYSVIQMLDTTNEERTDASLNDAAITFKAESFSIFAVILKPTPEPQTQETESESTSETTSETTTASTETQTETEPQTETASETQSETESTTQTETASETQTESESIITTTTAETSDEDSTSEEDIVDADGENAILLALDDSYYSSATGSVEFYAVIDGTWTLITTKTMTGYKASRNSRYYLRASDLEEVYGSLGFQASDYTTTSRIFAHTVTDNMKLWADANGTSISFNGKSEACIPILDSGVNCRVFYLPANNSTIKGTNSDSYSGNAANSFYTVKVNDPLNLVYTENQLPAVQYAKAGTSISVTVRNSENVTWKCRGKTSGTTIEGTSDGNGQTQFTISSISEPYEIYPAVSGKKIITYDINLPADVTPTDSNSAPTINDASTYAVAAEENSTHTVLYPSSQYYFYEYGSTKYLGRVEFKGWAINGDTTNLIQPGSSLDLSEYGETVTLTAQWEKKYGGIDGKESSKVNFFVSLAALPEGTTSLTAQTGTEYFTDSVFLSDCGINYNEMSDYQLYASKSGNVYYVLGGEDIANLNQQHETIYNSLTQGYSMTGTDGNTHTYQSDFPTDEEVLQNIRTWIKNNPGKITINGHAITADEATVKNFTIKWSVFKYNTDDGWHVDGHLVAKKGKMFVSKTFAGDNASFEAIRGNYSITVAASGNTDTAAHTGKTLTLTDKDVSFDRETMTYTWELDVDQYFRYKVTENNYIYQVNLITTTAQYNVTNSRTSGENTDGWPYYDDSSGVTVTGQSCESDAQALKVSLLNTYTLPGTLVLQKIDGSTGKLMPNVSFTVAKNGDDSFGGFYNTGYSHYTADSRGQTGTPTYTITTDAVGQAYLYIGGGTYTFTETVPTGYDDPGTITADLEGEASSEYKVIAIESLTAENGGRYVQKDNSDAKHLTMIVKNYARTVNLKVQKVWADNENTPVTLQLYRDGKSMGSGYLVSLDGKESTPWTYTWTGLPLYVDGKTATYSVREESIGDYKYSSEYLGGYRYYDVRYSTATYLDSSEQTTTDIHDASEIDLKVTNKHTSSKSVSVSITKKVTGGLGDQNKVFSFTVTSSQTMAEGDDYTLSEDKKTATFSLKHGEDVVLNEVKKGAVLTIAEETVEGYQQSISLIGGETAEMKNGEYQYTIPDSASGTLYFTVINDKEATPDTGFFWDTGPETLLLGLCAAGIILLILRRRWLFP